MLNIGEIIKKAINGELGNCRMEDEKHVVIIDSGEVTIIRKDDIILGC